MKNSHNLCRVNNVLRRQSGEVKIVLPGELLACRSTPHTRLCNHANYTHYLSLSVFPCKTVMAQPCRPGFTGCFENPVIVDAKFFVNYPCWTTCHFIYDLAAVERLRALPSLSSHLPQSLLSCPTHGSGEALLWEACYGLRLS